MKKFSSIQEWLSTNPSQEEQTKVITLINKGASHETRRQVYEKEKFLRKLNGIARDYTVIEMKVPKEIADSIKTVKKEIEDLKKDLPVIKPRVKKEKQEVVE
jgi:hypothetical protein